MPVYTYIFAILLGYLIGSLPFGFWIGRLRGVDVRTYFSGRTGATNVYRALGARLALLTGVLDFLKGAVVVLAARALFNNEAAAALAGAAAIAGHNWSVFLNFKGGAGGSTGAGALLALNPLIEVVAIPKMLDDAELREQVQQADVVVDACDNLPTRLAINAACVWVGTPLVTGAAIRLEGQVLIWRPGGEGACYRCLYRDAEGNAETCAQTGVLAPVVGVIGSIQAVEAIKVLTGIGETLDGRLLLLDALRMEWRMMKVRRNPACPVCGEPAP